MAEKEGGVMGLNCKQGDLAIVVRSKSGKQLGKIVRCISQLPAGMVVHNGRQFQIPTGVAFWQLDRPLLSSTNTGEIILVPFCSDKVLKPIRDTDGQDETLTWASRPKSKARAK